MISSHNLSSICYVYYFFFQGISFYEVKNRDLLAYTRDLVYLMYQMSIGNSIQGDPAIERLVYLRTVNFL